MQPIVVHDGRAPVCEGATRRGSFDGLIPELLKKLGVEVLGAEYLVSFVHG